MTYTLTDKIVLADMDGVICDYNKTLLMFAHTKLGAPLFTKEDCTLFNTEEVFPQEFRSEVDQLANEPGFFAGLDVIDGAIEALRGRPPENAHAFCACARQCSDARRWAGARMKLPVSMVRARSSISQCALPVSGENADGTVKDIFAPDFAMPR